MRGRKAKKSTEEVEEEPIERDDESRGMKMVDAMTTSLGREDELLPSQRAGRMTTRRTRRSS